MTSPSYSGPDYSNLPLLPAWYTQGWTSQNDDYQLAPSQIPFNNPFTAVPFPDLNYVQVTAEEFDYDGNPLGGYFTFMPSDNATVAVTMEDGENASYRLMKRYTGSDMFTAGGYNQAGSGRCYLYHGLLSVLLLATDNSGLNTDVGQPLFYYVKEHFKGGQEYQIQVPWNTVGSGPVDIRSLITTGPNAPFEDLLQPIIRFNSLSTQNVVANISASSASMQGFTLSDFDVNFAFTTGFSQPTENNWMEGTWVSNTPPFVADILVGPNNGVINPGPGTYTIWVRVVTPTEIPVAQVGTLIISN